MKSTPWVVVCFSKGMSEEIDNDWRNRMGGGNHAASGGSAMMMGGQEVVKACGYDTIEESVVMAEGARDAKPGS